MVVGLGGLGGFVLKQLACLGLGTIPIVNPTGFDWNIAKTLEMQIFSVTLVLNTIFNTQFDMDGWL